MSRQILEEVLTGKEINKQQLNFGDKFNFPGCGDVEFVRYDYYMGQQTVELYSEKYRQTFYPLPEKVEALGYCLP